MTPSTTRTSGKGLHSQGFTLIELLIVVAIIGVIAAIAIPSLVRARISANEGSALGSMRTINSAEASYHSSVGGGGYAVALAVLARPCPNNTQSFLSADLGDDPSVKSGYRLTLQAGAGSRPGPTDCNGTATRDVFYSTAVPVSLGITGYRGLASNPAGAIFFDNSGAPPSEASMAPGGGGQVLQ